MATIAISEVWPAAEATAYERLIEATGAEDTDSAFLGREPPDAVNYWAFFTGGGVTDANAAEPGCYTNLIFDAEWVGVYAERETAQLTAGLVLDLLNDTNNLKQVQNIERLYPLENPSRPDPVPVLVDGEVVGIKWRVEIPLVFIVSTTVY